jgi:gluconate 2-dehydrogenase gamma chain
VPRFADARCLSRLIQRQDAVLTDMEKNVATGFIPNAAAFFNLVRAHAIQGTFCDPYYGGNANFVGWDLIGYPGLRVTVGGRRGGAAAGASWA